MRLGAPRVAVDSVRAQDGKQKPKALQQHTGAKLPLLSCSPSLHTVWWRELTPGKLSLLFIFGKPEPDNQGGLHLSLERGAPAPQTRMPNQHGAVLSS